MTWEWVLLISVAMICLMIWKLSDKEASIRRLASECKEKFDKLLPLIELCQSLEKECKRIKALQTEFERSHSMLLTRTNDLFEDNKEISKLQAEIQRTAEDTKKLLTQANMTNAFLPRSMRQGG